ncbi:histidinol-phosphate transaminase [Helicobacter sp. 13S00401-1]|uniref:histidinol-phosphate transaminase n=1 Tax=Helicobacter sp. 13S00401-1 TaxID=1905758 RepID=UPI000BA65A0A|nr:histidinol-phosphate transaminase [Helicobacter sp. 13S00401-1]PAF51184.1 histidinol-phosphate transaminase [Helicobacter sp. 13S00401-1]
MQFNSHLEDLPVYEAGKPTSLLMREFGIDEKDIIKLGSNENPFGTSSKVQEVLKEQAKFASVYPDDSYYELKNALSLHHNVESKNIIIGSGSDQIIEYALHSKCDKDSKVLMARYTFAMYEIYTKQIGAKVVKTNSFLYDLNEMLDISIKEKIDVMFICTPNNPLGDTQTKEDIFSFLDRVSKDTLVVIDGAYMEYAAAFDKKYEIKPKDILKYENVLYLGTFSKAYGLGGMRVGYGIANEKIISLLHKLRAPFNITTLSLQAAITALEDKAFLKEVLESNVKEMKVYESFAEANSLEYIKSYANFITFNLQVDSTKVADSLLRKGIIIRNLKSYNLNSLRFTIGTASQNIKVLDCFKDALHDRI